jgi:hypothetical protein
MRNLNWPAEEVDMFNRYIAELDARIHQKRRWSVMFSSTPSARLTAHSYSQL